jgi:hypothetical protein
MRRVLEAMAALACLASCTHGASEARPDSGASPPVSAAPVAAGSGPAEASARGAPVLSWRGSYTSRVGTLYVPSDWKGVKWTVADLPVGLGEGDMRLALDPTGNVSGVVEGPLGPAMVAGFASDGGLTAKVSRDRPDDRGFAGTLVATITGRRIDGTMRVSAASAEAIRVATFALAPETVPPEAR